MEENRETEIEKRRNRGGVADIGTEEDGAIDELINVNERLITIKAKSIYELVMADTLDPEREKPDLPSSVHTKLLDRGSSDPLVARTFLTAKAVFQREHLPASIDVNRALMDMLDVVRELVAMETAIGEYNLENEKACKFYEERKGSPGFMLPAIPDMLTRCKTIFQKADQACQYLMYVIRWFYPELTEKDYYTNFEDFIKAKYGEDDPFSKFLDQIVPFIMEIRRVRNCFDHRKLELQLTGFELQDDGSVLSPTITMNYAGSTITRQDLLTYLLEVKNGLVRSVEVMLAYLASKHIQPMGKLVPQVREVPKEKRRRKMVEFGIWLPVGEGGYYSQ